MTILIQLLQIMTLQRRPQDLDYDQFSAVFYITLSIGIGYLVNVLAGQYSKPLVYSLVQNIVQLILLYGVLSLNSKSTRFVQTCTAIFGIPVILGCLTLLFSQLGLGIFNLFFLGWTLYMVVLIFKAALECSTAKALLIAVCLNLLAVGSNILLFPDFQKEVQAILNSANAS